MLTSITLGNFKSFGETQVVPLSPITVLVGPNNSGKSSFMSIGQFVRSCVGASATPISSRKVLESEGGITFLFHRPREPRAKLSIGWKSDDGGSYRTEIAAIEDDILGEGEVIETSADA